MSWPSIPFKLHAHTEKSLLNEVKVPSNSSKTRAGPVYENMCIYIYIQYMLQHLLFHAGDYLLGA